MSASNGFPQIPGSRMLDAIRDRTSKSPLQHIDVALVGAALVISGLGVVMIASATRTSSYGSSYFVLRQLTWIVLGLGVMAVTMSVDYRHLRDHSFLIFAGIVGVLVAVLVVGEESKGTQAWFGIGSFQLQPSEFAKLGLIIVISGYCHLHRGDLDAWRTVVAVGLAAVPLSLVMLQPDLGTALVLGTILLSLLLVAGVKGRHLAALALLAGLGIGGTLQAGLLKDYQVDRLTGFLKQAESDEGEETSRARYNLKQSEIAIGAGGIGGKGLGQGTQTSLDFVPEQHTDFIFTALGEELGFVGGAGLLALFGVLLWRIWRTAQLSADYFGTLVCAGVLGMLAFQVFQNIGMTMGIMPITGIPLPFMSYGGSSALTSYGAIGLVANIHMRRYT